MFIFMYLDIFFECIVTVVTDSQSVQRVKTLHHLSYPLGRGPAYSGPIR